MRWPLPQAPIALNLPSVIAANRSTTTTTATRSSAASAVDRVIVVAASALPRTRTALLFAFEPRLLAVPFSETKTASIEANMFSRWLPRSRQRAAAVRQRPYPLQMLFIVVWASSSRWLQWGGDSCSVFRDGEWISYFEILCWSSIPSKKKGGKPLVDFWKFERCFHSLKRPFLVVL